MPSPPGEPEAEGLDPADVGLGPLFNSILDAVVVADAQGRIVLWNPGAEALFGYPRAEALGRNVSMLVPPPLRERHARGMRAYAASGHGRLVDGRLPVELPALRKGGEEIDVELLLAPLEAKGRRYALAIARDATERVRLRREVERRSEALARANEALTQANESLTAFTYVVSHDLKEPVRAVDAYLRVLKEDHAAALPEDGREALDRAAAATERLAALLRGLLDLSRMDRADLDAREFDVGAALESDGCRAAYEALLRERDGALEAAPGIPRVRAPHAILCQVLGNLVANALRHGGAKPRVVVRGAPAGRGLVEISVEDAGPGYPRGFAEAFNQPGGPRAGSLGRGFGLLIARRGVERMGGRLLLGRSESLGGALARFTVPAAG